MVESLWKTVWQFFKMLNIEFPYDPTIPFLSVYSREIKRYVLTNFTNVNSTSIFHNIPKVETMKCPPTEWINKM